MNSKPIKDGGPAFPQGVAGTQEGHICSYDYVDGSGMSLRDWLAGMALHHVIRETPSDYDFIARVSYQIADAMLRAREAK